jgi:hypothetical protein
MTERPPFTTHRAHEYDWTTISEGSPYSTLVGTDTAIHISSVAGTQYHERGDYDRDLDQEIWPLAGDRLELVREPDNPYHENAIQIRWKNGRFMIGHVPRHLADELAPAMDAGQVLMAYCSVMGDCRPWSMCCAIIGPIIEDWMSRLEQCRIEGEAEMRRMEAEWAIEAERRNREYEECWIETAIETGKGVPAWEPDNPDLNQTWEIDSWNYRLKKWRDERRLDAVRAFRPVRGGPKIIADDLPVPEPHRPRRRQADRRAKQQARHAERRRLAASFAELDDDLPF